MHLNSILFSRGPININRSSLTLQNIHRKHRNADGVAFSFLQHTADCISRGGDPDEAEKVKPVEAKKGSKRSLYSVYSPADVKQLHELFMTKKINEAHSCTTGERGESEKRAVNT